MCIKVGKVWGRAIPSANHVNASGRAHPHFANPPLGLGKMRSCNFFQKNRKPSSKKITFLTFLTFLSQEEHE
jgi:hypothetical protein